MILRTDLSGVASRCPLRAARARIPRGPWLRVPRALAPPLSSSYATHFSLSSPRECVCAQACVLRVRPTALPTTVSLSRLVASIRAPHAPLPLASPQSAGQTSLCFSTRVPAPSTSVAHPQPNPQGTSPSRAFVAASPCHPRFGQPWHFEPRSGVDWSGKYSS